MGRWCVYRDGYRDLCRLWLTDEADGWYKHVTEATAELKRDFARMKRRRASRNQETFQIVERFLGIEPQIRYRKMRVLPPIERRREAR